jgi:hypothetical protein
LEYDSISAFYHGLARVRANDKYRYIDETGKEVIPCIYESVLLSKLG